MKILSFGTKGEFEPLLDRLRVSVESYGMPYDFTVLEPHRKFMAALKKPRYILDRLDGPVLWLDADSLVTGRIELPVGEWDVAFLNHWRTGSSVTCCAIAFQPTKAAREFLEAWDAECTREEKNFSGTEHDRMVEVRDRMTFREAELTDSLAGKLIVNYHLRKEHVV